jgi:hypothetical protein
VESYTLDSSKRGLPDGVIPEYRKLSGSGGPLTASRDHTWLSSQNGWGRRVLGTFDIAFIAVALYMMYYNL